MGTITMSSTSEVITIPKDSIAFLCEPNGGKKPPGWLDGVVGAIHIRDNGSHPVLVFDAEQWKQIKEELAGSKRGREFL